MSSGIFTALLAIALAAKIVGDLIRIAELERQLNAEIKARKDIDDVCWCSHAQTYYDLMMLRRDLTDYQHDTEETLQRMAGRRVAPSPN